MWLGQPYLRASASRKAPLCKVKPNSVSAREVNQLEASLSEAKSAALRVFSYSLSFRALASNSTVRRSCLWISFLMEDCMSQVSKEKMGFCAMMRSLSGSVVRSEAEYSLSEALVGLEMAMPPSLSGRAKRSRSRSPGGALPVREGRNSVLMRVSRGCRRELMWGVVRMR